MATQIIVDNQWATVRYETDGDYVYQTVHQPITSQVFQQTLNTSLKTLTENNALKILLDEQANGQFSRQDVEFMIAGWGVRAAQSGMKYGALVVPEKLTFEITVIVESFEKLGIHIGLFRELVEARQWLINL